MNVTTQNGRDFISKLARFINADDRIRASWDEAAGRDAAFDGGEWSGPACERMAEADADAAARRLGFASAELAREVAHACGVRVSSGLFLHEGIPTCDVDVDAVRATLRFVP